MCRKTFVCAAVLLALGAGLLLSCAIRSCVWRGLLAAGLLGAGIWLAHRR